jgi:hypothetical protein
MSKVVLYTVPSCGIAMPNRFYAGSGSGQILNISQTVLNLLANVWPCN